MIDGFKKFIMRGNIVDLAVAVVIGTAFAAVVDTVVASVIQPILNRIGGGDVGDGLGIQLGEKGNADTFIDLGAILNGVVVFLLTALVVYFIFVVPVNKAKERGLMGAEEEEGPSKEEELLTEICDLLKDRNQG